MDSEVARIHIEDITRLKERKRLTYSLNLEDMTGHRGSADKLFEISSRTRLLDEVLAHNPADSRSRSHRLMCTTYLQYVLVSFVVEERRCSHASSENFPVAYMNHWTIMMGPM
ncbi:hypothetical protein BDR07DRAFT_784017 [Suillus spraguei]|nr:hypothetical protein BDR07DRAFT_784017 [Suillus spraguei]